MQALLIYNPNAGAINNHHLEPEDITDALREAGYYPVYHATEQEDDLDEILKDAQGLVVSAGGDGTLRAVATRLVGRGIPIAPLPMGTANNLCRALEVTRDPLEIIAALGQPVRCRFDVGMVCFPWGKEYFLEAMGFGFYADALAAYRPENGKSVARSISSLLDTLRNFQPHPCQISMDGRELSGQYLNVEILNTDSFGPRIKITPEARFDDGLLDVVLIRPDERDSVLDYITQLMKGDLISLPGVQDTRGRRLDFRWEGWYPLHLDGEVRPQGFKASPEDASGARMATIAGEAKVTVEALPGAVEFWLPHPAEKD